jgi:hypothetical protein
MAPALAVPAASGPAVPPVRPATAARAAALVNPAIAAVLETSARSAGPASPVRPGRPVTAAGTGAAAIPASSQLREPSVCGCSPWITATDNGASTLYYHSRSIGLSVSNGDNYVVSFHFDPNRRPEHRLEERQLHQRAATEHDYSPYSDDEGNFPGREDF